MFIGIDWGGTKIEGVALTKEGKEMIRLRQDTPVTIITVASE